ncbi:hypothetical protein PILCRDRAFT_16628 [Piloderma croceum F 1598]|uniref:Uncharacterized protein n=1 Tax=Piloderma croceum (strain F 1598) TaxID=765440 RepID=A0A0C3EGT7_PILCF|nr:hypothetical protein PILCRDRAFT_16628 [Piloderma croceum F 1598]
MDKTWNKSIVKEDARAKQTKLAREKTQQNHPQPGSSSQVPSVFLWEEDIETSFLLKKAVSQNKAQHIWQDYPNNQHCYESTTNKWDICEALDPEPEKVMHFRGGNPLPTGDTSHDKGTQRKV